MSFKYKFTVFTPCYNSEKTLHRVFDSLMAQTIDHKEFEWLVINDASTDKTHELILEYIKKADFDVNYINLKQNQMLIKNYRLAIDNAQGELFLAIGHDDAFLPETLQIFHNIWQKFTDEEKEKCGSIACLCKNQKGQDVGSDFPINNNFVSNVKAVFGYQNLNIGETWAAIRTDELRKYFTIPSDIDDIVYIPESYFWNKMALLTERPYSFVTNKRLRIYYTDDTNCHLSSNIRHKYPKGFEFESLYFINNYVSILFKYPSVYIKHLMKYIMFSSYNKSTIVQACTKIKKKYIRLLFFLLYLPSLLYKRRYFDS